MCVLASRFDPCWTARRSHFATSSIAWSATALQTRAQTLERASDILEARRGTLIGQLEAIYQQLAALDEQRAR